MPYIVTFLATWVLMVSPVQNAAPVFSKPTSGDQQTSCFENIASSSSIYRVSTSDADGDTVTVAIHSQNPSEPPFQLTKATIGWNLMTPSSTTIDRETTANYIFVFSATDGTNTVQSIELTLILTDLDDNSPQFTANSYSAYVYDTASAGSVIITIRATDADVSPSITYTITAGDVAGTFSIASDTGELKLSKPGNLNSVTTPTYSLTVQASDGTNTNTTTVTIHVIDDRCFPQPCQNSGSCTRNETDFTCACASGWIGDTCSEDNPCISNPCQNGGICTIAGSTYNCTCTSGYEGPNCSTIVTKTTTTTTTTTAATTTTPKPKPVPDWIIALVITGVVVIVGAITITLYIRYNKRLGSITKVVPEQSEETDVSKNSFQNYSQSIETT
ncbi:protocadherin Fat 4-like [Dreissena polymorpha]|uniref:protocadherin Fat 4-like n=1 Tax=Dreissena polymorpha TaxID=45954 RepID=UPI002263DC5F|nr:protocadherin Fat 4-like [Dreissena polymorpha]